MIEASGLHVHVCTHTHLHVPYRISVFIHHYSAYRVKPRVLSRAQFIKRDQATTLVTTLTGGCLRPRASGNWAPAPTAAKDSLFSWHGCRAGVRCSGALKVIMAQLEQLPGSGRRPDLMVSSLY